MKTKLNLVSALVLQVITIFSGLIIPRLTIMTFGSSVNGLISSISQFLSFISLLEGGLGAVVLAELYKPIENRNKKLISNILNASNNFFKKLSIAFIVYTIILMIFYPIFFSKSNNYLYTSSLIFILSISTLIQYLLSITYTLMLQADQKIYVCNIVSSITILLNLIVSVIVVVIFPDVHLMKLLSGLVYLIQPIIYKLYFEKHYDFKIKNNSEHELKNKWSGFSQNLAHYITMNTDVMLLTVFTSFSEVSVYTIYMLPLNALRLIISSVANSFQSNLGKLLAVNDKKILNTTFEKFESILWLVSNVLFGTCLLLINQFVLIYTNGVNDANYFQPYFAYFMVLSQLLYCGRESYRLLVLAAGKFKETNNGAILEAIINITVSLLLVNKLGLLGVAIGTFISVLYRLIYLIIYSVNEMSIIKINKIIKESLLIILIVGMNTLIYYLQPFSIYTIVDFIIFGFIIFVLETVVIYLSGKLLKLI